MGITVTDFIEFIDSVKELYSSLGVLAAIGAVLVSVMRFVLQECTKISVNITNPIIILYIYIAFV